MTIGNAPVQDRIADEKGMAPPWWVRWFDSMKNAVNSAGTVTSVAQTFTGGIVSVGGSPITTTGTLALTVAGTSGGIPYFSSGTAWASSGALAQGGIVVGGGAGATPTSVTAGATTTILVGGGANTAPVWTTATGTGAPARAGTPSFTTTIGVGAATAAASGAGVTFPATQSASTDVNTLDDYEEGTWTPVLTGTGGTANVYAAQAGRYRKVGIGVDIEWSLSLTTVNATGPATVTGLPFTVATQANFFPAVGGLWGGVNTAAGYTDVAYYAQSATTVLQTLQLGDNVAAAQLNCATEIDSGSLIGGASYYQASA